MDSRTLAWVDRFAEWLWGDGFILSLRPPPAIPHDVWLGMSYGDKLNVVYLFGCKISDD